MRIAASATVAAATAAAGRAARRSVGANAGPNLAGLIEPVTQLAQEAGRRTLKLFRSEALGVDYKSDRTPVTEADQAAHDHIVAGLMRLTPRIPVLSEESGPEQHGMRRADWDWHWLVDPLDGTREFIRGSEEFTVNIALIRGDRPVLGVVDVPAKGWVYFAHQDGGAFIRASGSGVSESIAVRQPAARPFRVLASRSHAASAVELYVSAMGVMRRRAVASSLKFCLIAHGEADVYPRLGPISEWDSAAGQAVLECAGGAVIDLKGRPLRYRKPSTLNPPFIACGDPSHDWLQYLP